MPLMADAGDSPLVSAQSVAAEPVDINTLRVGSGHSVISAEDRGFEPTHCQDFAPYPSPNLACHRCVSWIGHPSRYPKVRGLGI